MLGSRVMLPSFAYKCTWNAIVTFSEECVEKLVPGVLYST